MRHTNTVPDNKVVHLNQGGRPTDPTITTAEALVEAIVAVNADAKLLEDTARGLVVIARQMYARADHLRKTTRPEIQIGYEAAEALVIKRKAA